eukprot:scaffold37553_cov63-Phaeocystis_antarctica.AAC.2
MAPHKGKPEQVRGQVRAGLRRARRVDQAEGRDGGAAQALEEVLAEGRHALHMVELARALVPHAGLHVILLETGLAVLVEATEPIHGARIALVGCGPEPVHLLLVPELLLPRHGLVAIDHAALHEVLERVAHLRRCDEFSSHRLPCAWAPLMIPEPPRDSSALVDFAIFRHDWVNRQLLRDRAHPLVCNRVHGYLHALRLLRLHGAQALLQIGLVAIRR